MNRFSLILASATLLLSSSLPAATQYYEFSGTILSSASYNLSYPVENLQASLGTTRVTYWFEVDFGNAWTNSNAAGTWYNFYSDLLGEGLMVSEIGTSSTEVHNSFNFDHNFLADKGEIVGGRSGVRISTTSALTPFWRVQDWNVGDEFDLVDLAVPSGGPGAVYYYGEVTLVSISSVVPEPSFASLGCIGLAALWRKRNVATKNITPYSSP
jgi:hypothetical protein